MKKILAIVMSTLILMTSMIPITAYATNAVDAVTVGNEDGKIEGTTIRTFKKRTLGHASGNSKLPDIWISSNSKYTVLKEEGGFFLVKCNERYLWIDTDEVLINIKEYIPSLDIRLSMANNPNLFEMGGKDIPGLTDTQYYTEAGSENGTEAWLMYRVAKKLAKAQAKFLRDGYSIVVYDAYRPYSATIKFRDSFKAFLNKQTKSFKNEWFGELGESWFLAQKASNHNYGIACDISLKDIKTRNILEMPSKMHTLDKRSAYYYWSGSEKQSTKNALYLKKIMESEGFSYLKSEWWHFEDKATKKYAQKMDIPN